MPASPALQETEHLCHHGETITYLVRYGRPNRVRMTLRVMSDGRVEILLPQGMPFARGHDLIRQRADWVFQQWQRAKQRRLTAPAPERRDQRYVLGILCRVERLVAHSWHGVTWRPPEDPTEGRLFVSARSDAHAEALLHRWYAQKTLETCSSRLEFWRDAVPWLTTLPRLRVRRLCRRWGSCSSLGVVTLASLLCRLPVPCIDYVLLHELTHLHIFNHSTAFYAALSSLLPDWQTYRNQLEAFPPPWQPATDETFSQRSDT